MIAAVKPPLHVSKRQKRFHESSQYYQDSIPAGHSPLQTDDECSHWEGYEEEDSEMNEIEEKMLDDILILQEDYEADSLVRRSRMRSKSSNNARNKKDALKALNLKIHNEKIRCSLLKVFTLLLQTESRLRGSNRSERMELMLRVKQLLYHADEYSIENLKDFFIEFCTSKKETLFPPHAIYVPSFFSHETGSEQVEIEVSTLISKTHKMMNFMEEKCKSALKRRLEREDFSQNLEEDWEIIREVWFVWLQFIPRSSIQLEVWKESLNGEQNLDSLLWNLSFYLSTKES